MDELDRMFRRLVEVVRADYPSLVDRPIEVGELYQSVLPYRHHRRELGLETNQDYELAMMRLLSGERGYVRGDARMQERLRQELAAKNPDTALFRGFATTTVTLDPEAAQRATGGAPLAAAAIPADASAAASAADSRDSRDRAERPVIERPTAERPTAERSTGERPVADQPVAQQVTDDRIPERPRPVTPPPSAPPVSSPDAETIVFRRSPAMGAVGPMPPMPPVMSPPPAMPSPPMQSPSIAAAPDRAPAPPPMPSVGPPPRPRPPADPSASPSAASRVGGATPASAGIAAPVASSPPRPSMATPQRGAHTIVASGDCRYCGGVLPDGRQITFCPHCGQNLTIQHCPACSTELELGWKFCTTCGRSVGDRV
ncbi:MAG TPA: zinc ribbon domain-containing protein [Gemmatimonadaceae bacterium]|nr:zinc ribbon domain-containing protein [Gemmatimonadaceae bacterium]